jgi:hypothetical protein
LNAEIKTKFEALKQTTFSTLLVMLFVFFLCWAALVILLQCVGWIKFATWQPVQFGALFLSGYGHEWISFYQDKFQPLNVVPALGTSREVDAVASALAGNFLGLEKIFGFILDTPLVIWLCLASSICFAAASEIGRQRGQ